MYKHRRLASGSVAMILVLILFGGIMSPVHAETSGEIKKKIEDLKTQEKAIEQQQAALDASLSANRSELEDLLAQKDQLDQSIALTREAIDNKNEMIQEYCLLIAETQNELDDALEQRDQLTVRYKTRIRSMEENGKLTYWSVLFKASSFTDLLERVEMINEIASSDTRMMRKLLDSAQRIETARMELAAEKVALEEAKEKLDEAEKSLDEKRTASDDVINQLLEDRDRLTALEEQYDEQKETLLQQIAKEESAYKAAVVKEKADAAKGISSYGFMWPTTSRYISCPFGPRVDPISGKHTSHSGMDIGANYGSPIYACKSGTVTKATYNSIFGYHVVINHGDGFSTLYGHMCQYKVRVGQTVTRGQVIGYVGSTGRSTGPHLHLTMYYNGSLVNPRKYLP